MEPCWGKITDWSEVMTTRNGPSGPAVVVVAAATAGVAAPPGALAPVSDPACSDVDVTATAGVPWLVTR